MAARIRSGRVPAYILLVLGSIILLMWAVFIASGVLEDGVRTVENNQYLVFHIAAECLMGFTLVAAGIGLMRKAAWADPAAFAGLGMTIYSTINSLAHSVRNEPGLTPVLVVSLALAVATLAMLAGTRLTRRKVRASGRDDRQGHTSATIKNRIP